LFASPTATSVPEYESEHELESVPEAAALEAPVLAGL